MKYIKWIFFDIGSTLIDESVAYKKRIEKTIFGSKVTYDEFMKRLIESYRTNKQGDTEIAANFKSVCSSFDLKPALWNTEDEFVYPESEPCLKLLSENYRIGIIANQNFGSKERLEKLGLLKYIDIVVASAEEGVAKPDLRIFKAALNKADCKAEEAVMIGDRLDNDIIPANKIGMTTVWIKQGFGGFAIPNRQEEKPDYEIEDLSELMNLF